MGRFRNHGVETVRLRVEMGRFRNQGVETGRFSVGDG